MTARNEMAIQVIGGPWPKRIGCTGTLVNAPPGYHGYPWNGCGKHHVIVLLDNDPLAPPHSGSGFGGQPWTCCMDRADVAPRHD